MTSITFFFHNSCRNLFCHITRNSAEKEKDKRKKERNKKKKLDEKNGTLFMEKKIPTKYYTSSRPNSAVQLFSGSLNLNVSEIVKTFLF